MSSVKHAGRSSSSYSERALRKRVQRTRRALRSASQFIRMIATLGFRSIGDGGSPPPISAFRTPEPGSFFATPRRPRTRSDCNRSIADGRPISMQAITPTASLVSNRVLLCMIRIAQSGAGRSSGAMTPRCAPLPSAGFHNGCKVIRGRPRTAWRLRSDGLRRLAMSEACPMLSTSRSSDTGYEKTSIMLPPSPAGCNKWQRKTTCPA